MVKKWQGICSTYLRHDWETIFSYLGRKFSKDEMLLPLHWITGHALAIVAATYLVGLLAKHCCATWFR